MLDVDKESIESMDKCLAALTVPSMDEQEVRTQATKFLAYCRRSGFVTPTMLQRQSRARAQQPVGWSRWVAGGFVAALLGLAAVVGYYLAYWRLRGAPARSPNEFHSPERTAPPPRKPPEREPLDDEPSLRPVHDPVAMSNSHHEPPTNAPAPDDRAVVARHFERVPRNTNVKPRSQVVDASDLQPEVYVVQKGDTLTQISYKAYGSQRYWPEIVRANPGIIPDRIPVGATIVLPTKTEVVTASAESGRR